MVSKKGFTANWDQSAGARFFQPLILNLKEEKATIEVPGPASNVIIEEPFLAKEKKEEEIKGKKPAMVEPNCLNQRNEKINSSRK